MINTIVNKNRLHLANEADYQGNINSYNNKLTQSFSKLFGISRKITINNESKWVNKKSYQKLLTSLEITPSKEESKNFDTLPCSYRKDLGLMRNHISSKKANKLGEKFIHAILANDMQTAKDLIGKGAQIDKHFWIRAQHGLSFKHLTDGLPYHNIPAFNAIKTTPFLRAVAIQNEKLMELLEQYRANESLTGEGCEFERRILNVDYRTNVQTVYHGNGWVDTNVSTTKYVSGQDYYRRGTQISYNASTKTLDYTPGTPDNVDHWTRESGSPVSGVQVATNALWLGAHVANAFSGR